MMSYLQKIGKAMMLPVAALPICGLLMGIGYLLCPATMQGGEITGTAQLVGLFLVQAGGAIIDSMPLLFAVGIGVGLSQDNDGTGGVAALVSWLLITHLLDSSFVPTIMPAVANNPDALLAYEKIANPFIGILAGIIGSTCYNRFKDVVAPEWLAFFSGKRCVALFASAVSLVVSFVLLFVWPVLFGLLITTGRTIAGMGALGAGIYAFLNRLLIPLGLHHALNNVFWFDTIGLGDLTHFWAGHTSADVTWSLGMYMSGFFPCMMFGIPGAALAMVHAAKGDRRRKAAFGILVPAALCAFVCGVTEPFEFAFMFAAPVLYVIYALLYGIFTFIVTLVGFRAGFAFSGGVTDLVFSASLPAAQNTWIIVPLGIAAFACFYVVFRLVIPAFDLKTPGRDESDSTQPETPQAQQADSQFAAIASGVLEACGGKENIVSVDCCVTRLRLEVRDSALVDEQACKAAGAKGVVRLGKQSVQVVIGTQVQFVADELKRLCG